MANTLHVARDLLTEALHRKWILGLGIAISVVVAILAFSLQLEIVDGVLAGTRLFGSAVSHTIQTTERALQPVVTGVVWTIYACGLSFGILACSDFAPDLLTPGRIEHLLSLPLSRPQLLLGTYLGVMSLAALEALYGAGLITLLLGLKAGLWSWSILGATVSGCIAFAAIYGVMLASAVFVRSAAVSAALGGVLWLAGTVLTLPEIAATFDAGFDRTAFVVGVGWLPRFSLLGHFGLAVGGYEPMSPELWRTVLGTLVFGMAAVALAVWEFERRDY